MAASILIAYATRYGSTQEVAEAVGARLREQGLTVEVRRAREVQSLDRFQAVVVGAPLYIGSLLREARKFLNRHRASLARMPVALFVLGPVHGGKELEDARTQLTGVLAKLPWLKPAATEVFVGKYYGTKDTIRVVARPRRSRGDDADHFHLTMLSYRYIL